MLVEAANTEVTPEMTPPNADSIGDSLSHLKQIAPGGFAIGLHVRFAAPKLMFNCYPAEWITSYARQGLLMSDPTVRWAMSSEGVLRWSDVDPGDDPRRVMPQAAEYGLRYGVTLSMASGARSFGGLAHTERPFDDAEIETMRAELARLHALTRDIDELDPATRARLAKLSIAVVTL